jgi:hypothetical protein
MITILDETLPLSCLAALAVGAAIAAAILLFG